MPHGQTKKAATDTLNSKESQYIKFFGNKIGKDLWKKIIKGKRKDAPVNFHNRNFTYTKGKIPHAMLWVSYVHVTYAGDKWENASDADKQTLIRVLGFGLHCLQDHYSHIFHGYKIEKVKKKKKKVYYNFHGLDDLKNEFGLKFTEIAGTEGATNIDGYIIWQSKNTFLIAPSPSYEAFKSLLSLNSTFIDARFAKTVTNSKSYIRLFLARADGKEQDYSYSKFESAYKRKSWQEFARTGKF